MNEHLSRSNSFHESVLVSRAAAAPGLFDDVVRGLTPNGTHFDTRLVSGMALAAGSCMGNRHHKTGG